MCPGRLSYGQGTCVLAPGGVLELQAGAMSNPRDSLPEPLRAQIESAALEFAAQIVGAFEQSIVDATARLAAQSSVTAEAAAAPQVAARPTKAVRKQGPAFERRIESALRKSEGGLGAEQLNRALGTTTAELTPALQHLMQAGRVGRRGKARGTKYFVI